MTAIALKILIAIFLMASGYVTWFVWGEYGKYRRSEAAFATSSRMENFLVGFVAMLVCLLMVGLAAFSGIMLFSQINVTLPWA